MPSSEQLVFVLALVAALGCGVVGGVVLAFSDFLMKALARIAPSEGIAAMQSINVVVLRSWFLRAFFATAVLCAVAIIVSLVRWQERGSAYLLIGGALYLAGTFMVTILFNVPRNRALASIQPSDPGGATVWADYLVGWTAWNHVRTAASLAAAAFFSIALA
jgi:uncharacterized membrane protein